MTPDAVREPEEVLSPELSHEYGPTFWRLIAEMRAQGIDDEGIARTLRAEAARFDRAK